MRTSRCLTMLFLCAALALAGCGAKPAAGPAPAPAGTRPAAKHVPASAAAAPPSTAQPSLFEYSTVNALVVGVDDGGMTLGRLKRYGNFGIGTINGLNGEVVEMDGTFYQIASSGHVHVLPNATRTPWMIVTHFAPQRTLTVGSLPDLAAIEGFLARYRPNHNVFYAMEITGTFSKVKARSVPLQHKPFPPLTQVTAHQSIFHFKNVRGTVFGFWTPNYLAGINVPGYHLHFLDRSRSAGGHVLALAIAHATVRIEQIDRFRVVLPNNAAFSAANLATQTQALRKAETNHPG